MQQQPHSWEGPGNVASAAASSNRVASWQWPGLWQLLLAACLVIAITSKLALQFQYNIIINYRGICNPLQLQTAITTTLASGADTGFMKGGGIVHETLPEAVHRGA